MRLRTGLGARALVLTLLLTCHSALPLAQVAVPPAVDRIVHDYAEVLTGESVSEMERVHRELFLKTEVAIYVVTMRSLDGEPYRSRTASVQ